MDTTSRRAPFIVIEGLDRSGKTTQTSKLHSRLQSIGVLANLMKFPGRCNIMAISDISNNRYRQDYTYRTDD
jgi:thymidylate kinase